MARLVNGSIVGSFEIQAFIGQGAFGITYRACHRSLGYLVALKEFFPRDLCFRRENGGLGVADATEQRQFDIEKDVFIAEAQALTPFRDDPNIVTVLDIIEANGTRYIVMQFIDGISLHERIGSATRKNLKVASQSETRFVLDRLLGALNRLHGQVPPLLHRDIKHSNIMIQKETDEPILIDFGAARKASPQGSRKLSTILTPGFAPYEQYDLTEDELQLDFSEVDPSTLRDLPAQGPPVDIYALGATGYFMLTGKSPPDALLRRAGLTTMTPATIAAAGRASPAFLESIDRALSIEPEDRFQSAADWRLCLEEAPKVRPEPAVWCDEDAPTIAAKAAPRQPMSKPVAARIRPVAVSQVVSAPSDRWWVWPATGVALVTGVLILGFLISRWLPGSGPEAVEQAPKFEAAPPASSPIARTAIRFADCETCPTMVRIPAGSYTMGSPTQEPGHRPEEAPLRPIRFDRGFALSAREVTVGDWQQCVNAGGCSREPLTRVDTSRTSEPAVFVTWHAAKSYAAWLRERTGKPYRLPTEAEWEYGARAGAAGPYGWDRQTGLVPANCSDCGSGGSTLKAVAAYPPNGFGLFDMHGNAWEWVEDCFASDLSNQAGDGSAVTVSSCTKRSIRGGGFANPVTELRNARRVGLEPDSGANSIGFRLARDL